METARAIFEYTRDGAAIASSGDSAIKLRKLHNLRRFCGLHFDAWLRTA
jgi:hypothetical protein